MFTSNGAVKLFFLNWLIRTWVLGFMISVISRLLSLDYVSVNFSSWKQGKEQTREYN